MHEFQIDIDPPDWLASPTPPPSTTTACPETKKKTATKQVPLLEHLCMHFDCTLKGFQLHLTNLGMRHQILDYCRKLKMYTAHLRPNSRNLRVHCQDISRMPIMPTISTPTICQLSPRTEWILGYNRSSILYGQTRSETTTSISPLLD